MSEGVGEGKDCRGAPAPVIIFMCNNRYTEYKFILVITIVLFI